MKVNLTEMHCIKVNSRRHGFILFEYMIAFALAAMMLFMMASVLGVFYVRIVHYSSGCLSTIEVAKAWFLLDRDFSSAPRDVNLWKKQAPSELVWTDKGFDCGWSVKRDRLIRSHGSYAASRGVWQNVTDSVVLMGLQRFMVRLIINDGKVVDGCQVTLDAHNHVLSYYVACRNYREIKYVMTGAT